MGGEKQLLYQYNPGNKILYFLFQIQFSQERKNLILQLKCKKGQMWESKTIVKVSKEITQFSFKPVALFTTDTVASYTTAEISV